MENQNDVFVVLLRLKSYLISLIDSPDEANESLEYSEEYLSRKFPGMSLMLLDMLKQNEIYSDSQIVFDPGIQEKFKIIAQGDVTKIELDEILNKYNIEGKDLLLKEEWNKSIKLNREEMIRQIVSILLKTANEWVNRKDLEENIDDISLLIEEDVLRAEELDKLNSISNATGLSFSKLSTLTLIYIKFFTDYLFEYGGDISLKNFQNKLTKISTNIDAKYEKLFDKNGLNNK